MRKYRLAKSLNRALASVNEALSVDFEDFDDEAEENKPIKAKQEEPKPAFKSTDDVSWKEPYNANYNRQYAEDVLYNTIGPLTDNPKYVEEWKGTTKPPPGFVPGGPAPRWTEEEVAIAYAGDPVALYSSKINPRSPKSGKGAPLYRIAKRISRQYNQDIMDIYQNGYTQLASLMKSGKDEGRSPFISWVTRSIFGASEHGLGGSQEGIKVLGGEATKTIGGRKVATGLRGLEALLKTSNPEVARDIADQVQGKYRSEKSYDKNPQNPFGPYSSRFYNVATDYSDALASQDKEKIDQAIAQINNLADEIERSQVPIRGASTGAGEAITVASRRHSITYKWVETENGMQWVKVNFKRMPGGKVKEILDPTKTNQDLPPGDYEGQTKKIKVSRGISSIDAENDETGSKQELPASQSNKLYDATSSIDPQRMMSITGIDEAERLHHVLNIALTTDISVLVDKSPKLQKIARKFIKEKGKDIFAKQLSKTGEVKEELDIGGRLTANEYRFILRHLGPLVADYPGKGVIRSNTKIPRDKPNWWKQGEDPELEPIPGGGTWSSIWVRSGCPSMDTSEIRDEMTAEAKEFEKLGIATGRSLVVDPAKKTEYVDPRTGKVVNIAKKTEDAVSTTAISTAKGKALTKLALLAKFLSVNESVISCPMIFEEYDKYDRLLLAETAYKLVRSLERSIYMDLPKNNTNIGANTQVKAILTFPNPKAAKIFESKNRAGNIIETYGREISCSFKSEDSHLINLAAKIACYETGYDENQYLITLQENYRDGLERNVLLNVSQQIINEIDSNSQLPLLPTRRPMADMVHYYELPEAVRESIDSSVGYNSIRSIKKWFGAYFVRTKSGKEIGINADGTAWRPEIQFDDESDIR
jgi:hypothetical protein